MLTPKITLWNDKVHLSTQSPDPLSIYLLSHQTQLGHQVEGERITI